MYKRLYDAIYVQETIKTLSIMNIVFIVEAFNQSLYFKLNLFLETLKRWNSRPQL